MNAQAASSIAGRRVLIVEDEMLIAMEMEDFLEQEGAVVVGTASSVSHGREIIARTEPELALLDLNLQGEVSAPLAAELAARSIPFVIVSGYGDGWKHHPEFRSAPHLQKPIEHGKLLALMASMFPKASQR